MDGGRRRGRRAAGLWSCPGYGSHNVNFHSNGPGWPRCRHIKAGVVSGERYPHIPRMPVPDGSSLATPARSTRSPPDHLRQVRRRRRTVIWRVTTVAKPMTAVAASPAAAVSVKVRDPNTIPVIPTVREGRDRPIIEKNPNLRILHSHLLYPCFGYSSVVMIVRKGRGSHVEGAAPPASSGPPAWIGSAGGAAPGRDA